MNPAVRVELASKRKLRERNKVNYRLAHWPIWIWVFFIAPGPLTFDLFERGFDARMAAWLAFVIVATGIAGLRGRLPGVEPKPYILRFTEDKPNPLYRRVCYTFAWSAVVVFAVLNFAWVGNRYRYRQVVSEANLHLRVLSPGGRNLVRRRTRPSAPRDGFNERRGSRAPLFLRLGMGRYDRTAGPRTDVEGVAQSADYGCRRVALFTGYPGVCG